MKNIEEILQLLSWSNSAEDQERGRDMAQNIEDISELIQPDVEGKSAWDNCAKVLCKKTDEQLEPYLCELLEWIQDINWPGAMLILGRLKHFSGIKLKEPVENAVKKAKGMDGEAAIAVLVFIGSGQWIPGKMPLQPSVLG